MALTTSERAELFRLESKRDKQIADYMRMGVLAVKEQEYEYFAPPAATEPNIERTNQMALTADQLKEALQYLLNNKDQAELIRNHINQVHGVEKPADDQQGGRNSFLKMGGVGDGLTDGQRAFAAGLNMPNAQFLPPGTARQAAAIKLPTT